MADEEYRIAAGAKRLPGQVPMIVRAMTRCDCGCGLPARFEFTVAGNTIAIADASQIDVLIEEMRVGREKLWGKAE